MVRVNVFVGIIFVLKYRLVGSLSPQCRCRNQSFISRPFHNPNNSCDLIPTEDTVKKFNAYVKNRLKIFILLNISFTASSCENQISNSWNDCNETDSALNNVLFPYHWTWVYRGQNGMYPLMKYPYDYKINSLWTLAKTKVVLDAVLTIPDNCVVTIGDVSLFRMVFLSLNNMAEPVMMVDWTGFLCYDINNSQSFSGLNLLMHHFLGFVRGITVKYCCPLQKDPKRNHTVTDGQDYKFCTGKVIPTTILMDLTTILSVIGYLIFPFILCYFLKEEPLLDIVPPDSTYDWINTEDGVFSLEHLMRWVLWWDHPSLTASRVRRVLFILFSPFIVYYHIIVEYFYMKDVENEYLEKDIPLGLQSILFGFRQNYKNTDGFLGGSWVWLAVYGVSIIFIVCRPKNIGSAIIGRQALQKKSSFTFLILDAATLKKYSSVDVSGHENYQLVFEMLKANLLLVLNSKFWIAIVGKWKNDIVKLWTRRYECKPTILIRLIVNICIMIVYIFLCLAEILACFCYYGCPIIFVFISVNVSIYDEIGCFLFNNMSRRFQRVPFLVFVAIFLLSISLTSLFLLYIFLLISYICLCSFFILNLTMLFTLIGIILTPEYIGYLAYLMSAVIYVNIIYKTFINKYNSLLALVARSPSIYVVNIQKSQFIRQDIFYDIVEQIRPLRFELSLLLLKYFLLLLYLTMSYNIIKQYDLSLQYTEKILSCLLITQIPIIVMNILSQLGNNSYQKEFNEKKSVKKILRRKR